MTRSELSHHLSKLGMDLNAEPSPEDLKSAWRKKCIEHHPDKGGDAKEFIEITHAYKMLTDPSYRESKTNTLKQHLGIKVVFPVRFEDAFFGKKLIVHWNQIDLDENLQPLFNNKVEIVSETIDFPPGLFQDFVQKFPEKGLRVGSTVGEATVICRPVASPIFEVQGIDVHTKENIPLDILLKGGRIEAQTLWGLKTLAVPAGTQPGEQLKISKCGVGQRGHHFVVCNPIYPTQETLRSNGAWKGLDIDWQESEDAAAKQNESDFEFESLFVSISGNGTGTW